MKRILSKFETYLDIDNMWYLDNGGSNYMTENRVYFLKLMRGLRER